MEIPGLRAHPTTNDRKNPPFNAGIVLGLLSQQFAKKMGPACASVTHLKLNIVFVDWPQSNITGYPFATETASLINTLLPSFPLLIALVLDIRHETSFRGSFGRTQVTHQVKVVDLVSHINQARIKHMLFLHIQAYQSTKSATWESMLQPLTNTDLQCLAQCIRLLHLRVLTDTTVGLEWNVLPDSLQGLMLHKLSPGPSYGSQFLNLRSCTMYDRSLLTSNLVLLMRASPMLREVVIGFNIIAFTNLKALEDLQFIQDFIEARSPGDLGIAASEHVGSSRLLRTVQASGITFKAEVDQENLLVGAFLALLQKMQDGRFYSIECSRVLPLQFVGPTVGPFLLHLAWLFPNVSTLALCGCEVHSTDLLTLTECRKLRAFHMMRCSSVTGLAVVRFVLAATGLLVLEAHTCPEVGVLAKQAVAEALRLRLVDPIIMEEKSALLLLQSSQRYADVCRHRVCVQALVSSSKAVAAVVEVWCWYRVVKYLSRRYFPAASNATVHQCARAFVLGMCSGKAAIQILRWRRR